MGLRSSETKIKNIVELVGVLTEIGCSVVQDGSDMFRIFNPGYGRYPSHVIISPNLDPCGYGPLWYKGDSIFDEDKEEYEHIIKQMEGINMESLDFSKYGLIFDSNEEGVGFLHELGYDSSKDFGEVNDFMFTHRDVDAIIPNQRDSIWYPKVDYRTNPRAVGMFYNCSLAFVNGTNPIREEVEPIIVEHHRNLREAYNKKFSK